MAWTFWGLKVSVAPDRIKEEGDVKLRVMKGFEYLLSESIPE